MPVVVVGMVTHLAAFALSLVFLPHLSPLGETDLPALSPPHGRPPGSGGRRPQHPDHLTPQHSVQGEQRSRLRPHEAHPEFGSVGRVRSVQQTGPLLAAAHPRDLSPPGHGRVCLG